jgi:hypothetical protein
MVDTPDVTPKAPSPDVTPPAAPAAPAAPANVVDQAEVERLRKEVEQTNFRNRQLENEKAAAEKAEAARKAKELEDNEQFKTLYETEKERGDRLEREKADADKKAEVRAEADKLLGEYAPEVRKLASDIGLNLADTDDASKKVFTDKLEALNAPFGGKKVQPNNPPERKPDAPSFGNAEGVIEAPLAETPDKFDELVKNMPGIASMMGPTE